MSPEQKDNAHIGKPKKVGFPHPDVSRPLYEPKAQDSSIGRWREAGELSINDLDIIQARIEKDIIASGWKGNFRSEGPGLLHLARPLTAEKVISVSASAVIRSPPEATNQEEVYSGEDLPHVTVERPPSGNVVLPDANPSPSPDSMPELEDSADEADYVGPASVA